MKLYSLDTNYALLFLFGIIIAAAVTPSQPSFDWNSIQPTTYLAWYDCYTATRPDHLYVCARLALPLDWRNASNPERVAMALIKLLPGSRPDPEPLDSSAASKRPIVLHPGSAAPSAVDTMLAFGPIIQSTTGAQHAIITVDRRGVMHSTPTATCFRDELTRQLFEMRLSAAGALDMGPASLAESHALRSARARLCVNTHEEQGDNSILKHMSTTSVARDLLELAYQLDLEAGLIEPVNQQNSYQGSGVGNTEPGFEAMQRVLGLSTTDNVENSSTIGWDVEESRSLAKLRYIGLSHGSFVGQYFASMYPRNIDRMILDGIIDTERAFADEIMADVSDSEEAWRTLLQLCFESKDRCAIYRRGDAFSDLTKRIDDLVEEVKKTPVEWTADGEAGLLTYSDLKNAMMMALLIPLAEFQQLTALFSDILVSRSTQPYKPLTYRPSAAQSAADLVDACSAPHSGNTTSPASTSDPPPAVKSPHGLTTVKDLLPRMAMDEANALITAGDLPLPSEHMRSSFEETLKKLAAAGPIVGPPAVALLMDRLVWPESVRPTWRYEGPFASDQLSTPILFLNNRLDAASPLHAAKTVARRFKGSVVVEQDTVGHVALLSAPGECLTKRVAKYLNTGELAMQEPVNQTFVLKLFARPYALNAILHVLHGNQFAELSRSIVHRHYRRVLNSKLSIYGDMRAIPTLATSLGDGI